MAEEITSKPERQPTESEKIFENYAFDETIITRIYKKLNKLSNNKTSNTVKKLAEYEQVLFKGRNSKVQQTHEEVLGITAEQGNANNNHNEILHHQS